MDRHFKIIVPFYNVAQWINLTLRSIKLQDYDNFECIIVDDMSTDDSLLCDAIELSDPKKEDVIVMLDGDDWFAGKGVLSVLNETYDREDCWMTYGSYIEYPSNVRGKFSQKVPDHIISGNLFRSSPWMTSHLRTWKYGLWKGIDKQKSFVEDEPIDNNNHYAFCWDLAYMFPLLELAGTKAYYISDILYVYNRQNPLCCDKIKHDVQLKMEHKIRNMERYKPLEEI